MPMTPQMQIETQPRKTREVTDWDFMSVHGLPLSITVDPSFGDTVYRGQTEIEFSIKPRPSLSDPTTMLPAEDVTVFIPNIIAVKRRNRVIPEASTEEREAWQRTILELTKATPKLVPPQAT